MFIEESVPFRFCGQYIVLIDTQYLEQEVLQKTIPLLQQHGFDRANEHFKKVRNIFISRDWEACITESCNALESTIQHIADRRITDRRKQIDFLKKQDIFPDYFEGFIESFMSFPKAVFTIQDNSSAHSDAPKKATATEADPALASLALNQAGSLLVFIMERYSLKSGDE